MQSENIMKARESIFQVFRSLPLALSITILLLGSFQGNMNLLIFFVGMGVLIPLLATVLNILFEFIFKYAGEHFSLPDNVWLIPEGTTCTLFDVLSEKSEPLNGVPTVWTPMTVFFFTYLFLNAYDIYNRPVPKGVDESAVNARKTRCGMSMFTIVIVFVLVMIGRYSLMHCENALGLGIGSLLGLFTAWMWYSFVRSCGLGRFDDIFGISNRMLSPEVAGTVPTKVCVPVAG